MAAVIGSLRAILGLDSAEFTNGLKKANAGMNGFIKTAGIGFAAVAAAAATAGAALSVAVKGAIDNADEMGEMAQKIGVSVEALSSLGYAAKLSGTDTETLSTSIRKLSQNMLAVAQGSVGPVATAFKALGISVQEADGSLRASDDVLLDIADKFARMEDGATKTALAVQLFGKSGAELVPFLSQGSAGIAELTAEADRLGITISGTTASAAGEFNDTLDRLQATFQGVINKVAAGVLPKLNELGAKLSDPQFAASAQSIGQGIVDGLKLAVDAINTTVGALTALGEAMAAIGVYNRGDGFQRFNTEEEAKSILAEKLNAGQTRPPSDVYQGIFGGTAAELTATNQTLADSFVPVIENTQAATAAASELKAIMSDGQAVFEATRTPAEAYALEVERLNGLLQKGAIDQDTYNRAVMQAQDAFQQAENKGGQLASTLASGLASVFSSVIDGSKSAVEAVGDLLKSLGNLLINKAFQSLLGGLLGGGPQLNLGFNLPSFDGGGYTGSGGGTGLDGKGGFLAMLHPDETVIDHSKGQGMGPTIQISINGSRQDAAAIAREVQRVIPDAIKNYNRNPMRRPG